MEKHLQLPPRTTPPSERLYDCDFNQMLEMPLGACRASIWEIDTLDVLLDATIAINSHCFGCTAEAGSSCGGAFE